MRDSYSLYEAKARLSALVRRVREGHRVLITVHGRPAAELRPVGVEDSSLEERLACLEERGIVIRRRERKQRLPATVRRPGALGRFLAGRD
jgi:prevent-host-death family protein